MPLDESRRPSPSQRFAVWKLLPFLALFAASPALAGPKEDADAAIARGVALRKAHDNTAALEEFQKAHALYPSPRSYAQLGLTLHALGLWVEAEPLLIAALAAQKDSWIIKNRQPIQGSLDAVSAHLGSLEIVGSPAGAEVIVEQRKVGVLPLSGAVRATAGTVAIEVRAPGYLPVTRNVVVSARTLSRETVSLTPVAGPSASENNLAHVATTPPPPEQNPQPVPAQPAVPRSGNHDRTILTWVTGIGAAAFAAVGVAALVVRAGKDDQLNQRLNVKRTCTQMGDNFAGPDNAACVDLATSKDRWTWVAVGGFTAAGLGAITTAVLLVTRPTDQEAGASAAASTVPRITAGLRLGGPFLLADWSF